MSRITSDLLSDTLSVIALARETALARGRQAQADRLAPVVEQLRDIAAAREAAPAAPSGALKTEEFQTLLAAAQGAPLAAGAAPAAGTPAVERGQVAAAMSAGGMGEVDIARQLGVTRDEVRMMLALDGAQRPAAAVSRAQIRGRYQA